MHDAPLYCFLIIYIYIYKNLFSLCSFYFDFLANQVERRVKEFGFNPFDSHYFCVRYMAMKLMFCVTLIRIYSTIICLAFWHKVSQRSIDFGFAKKYSRKECRINIECKRDCRIYSFWSILKKFLGGLSQVKYLYLRNDDFLYDWGRSIDLKINRFFFFFSFFSFW